MSDNDYSFAKPYVHPDDTTQDDSDYSFAKLAEQNQYKEPPGYMDRVGNALSNVQSTIDSDNHLYTAPVGAGEAVLGGLTGTVAGVGRNAVREGAYLMGMDENKAKQIGSDWPTGYHPSTPTGQAMLNAVATITAPVHDVGVNAARSMGLSDTGQQMVGDITSLAIPLRVGDLIKGATQFSGKAGTQIGNAADQWYDRNSDSLLKQTAGINDVVQQKAIIDKAAKKAALDNLAKVASGDAASPTSLGTSIVGGNLSNVTGSVWPSMIAQAVNMKRAVNNTPDFTGGLAWTARSAADKVGDVTPDIIQKSAAIAKGGAEAAAQMSQKGAPWASINFVLQQSQGGVKGTDKEDDQDQDR